MTVYVLSQNGNPLTTSIPPKVGASSLMPTERHGKVKRLLKQSLAKVVKTIPFTIKLLYATTEYMQPVIIGVDIGTTSVPISALANGRVVYLKEKILRLDVQEQ